MVINIFIVLEWIANVLFIVSYFATGVGVIYDKQDVWWIRLIFLLLVATPRTLAFFKYIKDDKDSKSAKLMTNVFKWTIAPGVLVLIASTVMSQVMFAENWMTNARLSN